MLFHSHNGSVWKAIHKRTGVVVAIKKVEIDANMDGIVKEIDFMKGCTSPYVVRCYESYTKENELWV
jgi:serine/threonine kinase 3